jgi:hypothetical protein
MDVDGDKKSHLNSGLHKMPRYRQLFIMNFEGIENPMFVIRFFVLVCFVCLFVCM